MTRPTSDRKIYGKLFALQAPRTAALFGEPEPAYYTLDGAIDMYGPELQGLENVAADASWVDADGDTWVRVQ